MNRLKLLWIFCLTLAAVAGLPEVSAQGMASFPSSGPLPPKPAKQIEDRAGLFVRDPSGLAEITARLRELDQKHGFTIYVLVESMVMNSHAVDLAARLQQAWLPDGNGMVIVYEVDKRAFGIGRPYDTLPSGQAAPKAMIPSYAAGEITERVRNQLAEEQKTRPLEGEALLDRLTASLCAEVGGYLDQAKVPDDGRATRKVLGFVSVALAVLGLAGFVLIKWMVLRGAERDRVFFFPAVVENPHRLGAPFGAKVSVTAFRGPASSDPR